MTEPNWFEAGCTGQCRKEHSRMPGYCALVPPPEPTVSFLRVEDAPDGGRHIVTRSIPEAAWRALIDVASYVSRGWRYTTANTVPYPDAKARRALGALDDAGLLSLSDPPRPTSTAPDQDTKD